jgi:neutral ceramidase
VALFLYCLTFCQARAPPVGNFKIGSGIYDITGPAAEVGMMGYAQTNQRTHGLHMRLRARAFVFLDDSNKRLVLVNLDLCMTFQMIKWKVIEQLQKMYGNLYTHDNVIISSIHTHSGPAGYSMYVLYDVSSFGFYEDNFKTIVAGIVEAIRQAHESIRPAKMFLNSGVLHEANINRSPSAYLMNPKSEIARYDYNTDQNFTLLRIEDGNGKDFGMINWFSVHCTSMNNTNTLISSDNKGYAALLFEKQMNGPKSFPGRGPFVAVFQQSNEGDVSPNTRGPSCPDGSPCDDVHSTCNGKSQGCWQRTRQN